MPNPEKLHFIGITGHTMRGLALAAKSLGYEVTGTDEGSYSVPGEDALDAAGIKWSKTPDPTAIIGISKVIISGGSHPDDPEIVSAKEQGIPVLSYAEFVGELAKTKRRIVITGTHGKTTTTSLAAWLLESAGKNPDYLIGITPRNFETSVRISDSNLMVLEGDEYKSSSLDERSKFMYYKPDVLVATSLEMDHPDLFPNLEAIKERFSDLIKEIPEDGSAWYWSGSDILGQLAEQARCQVVGYGETGQWRADHVTYEPEGLSFDVYNENKLQGHYFVPLYGSHNVDNAVAAIGVVAGEGLTSEEIQTGLAGFKGATRRFSIVSAPDSMVTVVDDYAHHPTEIATTIEAAKLHFKRRVLAIVRPHTYSRTKELLPEYRQAVTKADLTYVTDIEGAREAHLAATVSGKDIATDNGDNVRYADDREVLVRGVINEAQPGDVILCMTVSGYDNLAEDLAARLRNV